MTSTIHPVEALAAFTDIGLPQSDHRECRVMAEHNQEFRSFEEWCNKASSWLTRRGPDIHAICYDRLGRHCTIGRDFMRARDEDAFPVRWLWPDQVASMKIINPADVQIAE